MGNEILVSIIVPVYNVQEELLLKCFNSLEKQNNHNLEIIIIDDGSNEHCASFCDQYWENKRYCKVFHQKNQGLAGARNVGVKQATGKYVFFLDSDDWLLENAVQEIMKMEISSGDYDVILFNNSINSKTFLPKYENDIMTQYNRLDLEKIIIEQRMLGYNTTIGSAWGKLFRRSFLIENNIFADIELRRTQDRLFMLECLDKKPKIKHCCRDVMCFNVKNDSSLSRSCNYKNLDYLMLYLDKCIEFVNNCCDSKELLGALDYLKRYIYINCCTTTIFHIFNRDGLKKRYNKFCEFSDLYLEKHSITPIDGFTHSDTAILKNVTKRKYGISFLMFELSRIKKCMKRFVKKLFVKGY